MKKRLRSLALAAALALGLAAPAAAADTSGLDAKGMKAYYDALAALGADRLVAYAELKDLDGDGVPELIAIPGEGRIVIWQMRNGQAVKSTDVDCDDVGYDDEMGYATRGGKTYVYAWAGSMEEGAYGAMHQFVTVGGFSETLRVSGDFNDDTAAYSCTKDGKTETLSEAEYKQRLGAYVGEVSLPGDGLGTSPENPFHTGGGLSWYWGEKDGESYEELLAQLKAQADAAPAPAAGTYGAYSIRSGDYGGPFTAAFDAAKVEIRTVQLAIHSDVDLEENGGLLFEPKRVCLVSLRPGSAIRITHDAFDSSAGVGAPDEMTGFQTVRDSGGRYIQYVGGTMDSIFPILKSGSAQRSDEAALLYTARGDVEYYLIETDSGAAPAASAGVAGFADVKAGDYYADAVRWAVERKIANGTGPSAFSPDRTCSAAQILTFLWNANGAPEPAGRNPFSNVSASDYYYKAAVWASEQGLVRGAAFPADTPCTRGMAVNWMWKLAGSPGGSVQSTGFSDVPANSGYAQAVVWAVENGITSGTGQGRFSLNETCTRGQIVTFLHRAMGK